MSAPKTVAVILGEADVYVHSGGQHEWDLAAPAAVALAAGLHVSRLDGSLLGPTGGTRGFRTSSSAVVNWRLLSSPLSRRPRGVAVHDGLKRRSKPRQPGPHVPDARDLGLCAVAASGETLGCRSIQGERHARPCRHRGRASASIRAGAGHEREPRRAISNHQASTSGDVPVARVIHHGLDTTRFPIGDGRGGYAVFLGRISPTKGVEVAIGVARRVGMPLVIAAKQRERQEREYFDADIRPLLGRDVHYVGEIGGLEKLRLLGDAAALLNPICWDEPFGMCMIEAMACATPVVATPRGSVPEIVDDGVTGFVRAGTRGLADALTDVGRLDRRACRASVETRFSMQRMAADHLAFYAEVIAGRVAGHARLLHNVA
jgi:glycosyltransferase involved in cell wall biosynthesis